MADTPEEITAKQAIARITLTVFDVLVQVTRRELLAEDAERVNKATADVFGITYQGPKIEPLVFEHHPLCQNDEGHDTGDADPGNWSVRAGYLSGLAIRFEKGTDEYTMLRRAARSLEIVAMRALDRKPRG